MKTKNSNNETKDARKRTFKRQKKERPDKKNRRIFWKGLGEGGKGEYEAGVVTSNIHLNSRILFGGKFALLLGENTLLCWFCKLLLVFLSCSASICNIKIKAFNDILGQLSALPH